MKKKKLSMGMLLVTIGIVYGDIGTSPMYVLKSILEGNGGIAQVDANFIIGSISLVIWTMTLLTTVKYVGIALRADNDGEGGIFALYSLIKGNGRWLIVPAMVGGAAILADGILTPAVTVTTAIEGLRSIEFLHKIMGDGQGIVLVIVICIIIFLFAIQSMGTSKIGKAFGPVMVLWFSFLGIVGLIHVFQYPLILKAFNPIYAFKVLVSPSNKVGFMILGSVFLATTGAEALYSDIGHVGRDNIYASWPLIKTCLILNYLGQGAWIICNQTNTTLYEIEDLNPFFQMLAPGLRPIAVLLGAAAAIIASQALITGSYTLVSEASQINLLPHLEIRYPAETKGQIYIPVVNHILFFGCLFVILYFRTSARMESAYGLAITMTMLSTTLLLSVYLWYCRKKKFAALVVLVVFGIIESVFFVSSLGKFAVGGYFSVLLAFLLFGVMCIWYQSTIIESRYFTMLKIRDYIDNLRALKEDKDIPLMADNLVYIDKSKDIEYIDRDILYSILDKDTKRANAYWFVSVNITNKPNTFNYEVENFGTDFIYHINLNLGFKKSQKINGYIRQITQDLIASGELPVQHRKFSIYGDSPVGTFKFCMLKKSVPYTSALTGAEELMLRIKYAIRRIAGSMEKWYGLDTSALIIELVPLFVGSSPNTERILRKK